MNTADVRGLLGLFLADGYLALCRGATKTYIKATLNAGAHEQDFLEEKIAEVRQFVPTQARIVPYQTPQRESGKRTTVLRFRFTSHLLRPVYNLLYPFGEREITRAALELLGGRAAAWLWAEGCKPRADGVTLRHVGLLEDEARLISGWLQLLTGAESSVLTEKTRPRLHFNNENAKQVRKALLPYAPETRKQLFLEIDP